MQYKRRSGVIIKETDADYTLLDIIDNQKESMRDLALVSACLSKASPKLFSFLKAEVQQCVPGLQRMNEILNFIHPELNVLPNRDTAENSINETQPILITTHSEPEGKHEYKKESKPIISEMKEEKEEFMPMHIETPPVKRSKISKFIKL